MGRQERSTAIVLAAGSGKRMGADVPKQFLPLDGRPALYYTLRAFEDSAVDEVVLVVSDAGAQHLCRETILAPYGLSKVRAVVTGGAERYDSVWAGLCAVAQTDYVLIHDGVRCLVTPAIIADTLRDAKQYGATVAAVPVKDTIKTADADHMVGRTLDRRTLWQIQTPQAFAFSLVYEAYRRMQKAGAANAVTDDAQVVEQMLGHAVHLTESSYENIKLTTPGDLLICEAILQARARV